MIIITGCTSFVGKNLLDRLEKMKTKSVCLIRDKEDKKIFSKLKCPEFIVGNLFSNQSLRKYIKKDSTVIHLANITNASDPELYYINVEGTRNIIDLCKEGKIKNLIYLGSSNIYKKNKDCYDKSKFIAERLILSSNLNYTMINPGVIYGKYDYKNIAKIIQKMQTSKVKISYAGEKEMQPVYVGDVIDLIINNLENKKNKEITILTNPITKKEFLKTIKGVFKMNLFLFFIPSILMKILFNKYKNQEIIPFSPREINKELNHPITDFYLGLKKYSEGY